MTAVVWWLTQREREIVTPDGLDPEVVQEFNSSVGRPGRGRLWGKTNLEIEPDDPKWKEALGAHCSECAGIVVSEAAGRQIWDLNLPGLLTDLKLKRWHPLLEQSPVQLEEQKSLWQLLQDP